MQEGALRSFPLLEILLHFFYFLFFTLTVSIIYMCWPVVVFFRDWHQGTHFKWLSLWGKCLCGWGESVWLFFRLPQWRGWGQLL